MSVGCWDGRCEVQCQDHKCSTSRPHSPFGLILSQSANEATAPTVDGPTTKIMSDAVTASAKGATFLILVQIVSKALTFAMNQLLLRHLSPALLGASVQLELYKIGVLYFSRESLRVATERRSPAGVQAAVNLSYLALLAGVPIGLGFAQWYLHVGPPDVPWFVVALRINEIAAVVELLSEPAYVTVQQKMLFKIRAAAEVPGVMVKTATIAAVVFWSQRKGVDLGVLPFAVGELANSATLTLLYLYQTSQVAKQERFSLFPRKLKLRCVRGLVLIKRKSRFVDLLHTPL